MAGQTDQQTPQAGSTPVPDLIERYRLRRDAWIAQADELARLRDEVRGSAEREAMEIVTAARRDVRKVIMEARRELLVLSAQVQAALGEATGKTDPATLLNKAGITPEAAGHLPASAPDTFAAENAVNEILNEVQDEITALAADARALPLQNVSSVRQIAAPPVQPPPTVITPAPSRPQPTPAATSAPSSTSTRPADIPTQVVSPEELELDVPELSDSASQALLSSQFPSDAVPVQNGRRFHMLIALFVGVGLTVAAVTIWWLSNRGTSQPESRAASAKAATSSGSPAASGALASGDGEKVVTPRATSGSSNLLLVAEAVRDVWVRTTVDGRTGEGRTLAAGQTMDVSAEQSISIRVGDAGAVVVSVNNGEKRPLGRDGQVVTRQFVVEGSKTPARPAAPQSAEPTPAPPGNTRNAPPVAAARPLPPPFPISSGATTQAAAPPMPAPQPVAPTSIAPPLAQAGARPPASQPAANTSQPAAPSGIVTQLSATASPSPAPNASAAVTPASPATTVVAIARQWLEAYHRQDRAAMAALSTDNLLLADERRADERFPPGLSDVTRTLDRVSVQIAADTAVLTAVMMEQSGSSPATPHVSPISQVWVLGGGQWKVRQARFVSEARLNQVFK
jgi:hypothetical protein